MSLCCADASECSYASDGSDYVGTVSHTVNGLPCQMWESNTPHKHRYNMLTQDQNYCRNPDSSVAPWCMTMDPAVRLGYCDVPRCGTKNIFFEKKCKYYLTRPSIVRISLTSCIFLFLSIYSCKVITFFFVFCFCFYLSKLPLYMNVTCFKLQK